MSSMLLRVSDGRRWRVVEQRISDDDGGDGKCGGVHGGNRAGAKVARQPRKEGEEGCVCDSATVRASAWSSL